MTIQEFNTFGKDLEENLILRYSPIALKLIYSEDEIPEGTLRPCRDRGDRMAMCQAYAMVRRQRKAITMLKEDHWCVWPLVSFGMVTLDDDDYEYMGDKFFFKDKERSKRFLREEYPMLAAEKKLPLADAIHLGAAAACASLRMPGATEGMVTMEEVLELHKTLQ